MLCTNWAPMLQKKLECFKRFFGLIVFKMHHGSIVAYSN